MQTIEDIIKDMPDKSEWKTTTTLDFKRHLHDFFNRDEFKDKKVVELGTAAGHTTRVLSFLFNKVTTIDIEDDGKSKILNADRGGVSHKYCDIYSFPWWEEEQDAYAVFVDAVHKKDNVALDIQNSLKIKNLKYLIFDDFGLFPEVKEAVYEAIVDNRIKPVCYIGQNKGSECAHGRFLLDREGIICEVLDE
tara:strand:+ start:283 stop:858 length:576 start_codon:yes stop_codon:yes gene_type:complete